MIFLQNLQEQTNRYTYTPLFAEDILVRIIDKLKKHYNKSFVEHRGTFMYQPGGRCGWHTNSNSPGKRIYFTWTEEDNKSFFKYLDNETDQIITKYDKKGWHINEFIIPKEGVFWHYVGSETCRKSIGFLINMSLIKDIVSNIVLFNNSDNIYIIPILFKFGKF